MEELGALHGGGEQKTQKGMGREGPRVRSSAQPASVKMEPHRSKKRNLSDLGSLDSGGLTTLATPVKEGSKLTKKGESLLSI